MDEKSVESSMGRTKQKIFDYAKENEWEYFVTLTFNPAKVERTDYEDCSNKLRHWLNHLKARVAPDLRYMVVPEFHEDGKSYHFHGLISHTGNMEFVNSGKTTKDGDIIYNLGDYALGWTTATKIKDTLKASRYITEYITKELCAVTQNKKRYWRSNNLKLPKVDKLYYEDKEAVSEAYAKISSHTKTVDVPAINNKVTYYNVKGDKDDEIENSDK